MKNAAAKMTAMAASAANAGRCDTDILMAATAGINKGLAAVDANMDSFGDACVAAGAVSDCATSPADYKRAQYCYSSGRCRHQLLQQYQAAGVRACLTNSAGSAATAADFSVRSETRWQQQLQQSRQQPQQQEKHQRKPHQQWKTQRQRHQRFGKLDFLFFPITPLPSGTKPQRQSNNCAAFQSCVPGQFQLVSPATLVPVVYVLLLLLALRMTPAVEAQIRVQAPKALIQKLKDIGSISDGTGDLIIGSTASFGIPDYGSILRGKAFYAPDPPSTGKLVDRSTESSSDERPGSHCSPHYCDSLRKSVVEWKRAQGEKGLRHAIFVVDRGLCTFCSKVRIAQQCGASAVIVVDRGNPGWDRAYIRYNVIMSDDGTGDDITIPSMLIAREEGSAIIESIIAAGDGADGVFHAVDSNGSSANAASAGESAATAQAAQTGEIEQQLRGPAGTNGNNSTSGQLAADTSAAEQQLGDENRGNGVAAVDDKQHVLLELEWNIPLQWPVYVVFWTDPGEEQASKFLQQLAPYMLLLGAHVRFSPLYYIFEIEGNSGEDLCLEEGIYSQDPRKYCAFDPAAYSSTHTGKEVAEEALRQACLHHTTAHDEPNVLTDGRYSTAFWQYQQRMADPYHGCFFNGEKRNEWGRNCSQRLLEEILSAKELRTLQQCMSGPEGKKLLDLSKSNRGWSSIMLRINGARFTGSLDAEAAVRAICASTRDSQSGKFRAPECEDIVIAAHKEQSPWLRDSPDWRGFFTILLFVGVITGCAITLYYRTMKQRLMHAIRQEVATEVFQHLQQYYEIKEDTDHSVVGKGDDAEDSLHVNFNERFTRAKCPDFPT